MPSHYEDPVKIRELGRKVIGQMTTAECMWHLGNYAKHNEQLEELDAKTIKGLIGLAMIDSNGEIKTDADYAAVKSISGKNVRSLSDLQDGLRIVERSLREWADNLENGVIGDLDEFRYGDRTRTKRENETFAKFLAERFSANN